MTREQALKKLRKLLGKNAAFTVHERISSPEARARALESRRFLSGRKVELSERLEARRKALLDGDPEYQSLLAELRPVREQIEKQTGEAFYYKFVAGTVSRLIPSMPIFHIEASGDTWEDVIAKIEAKKR
jgi:hypothetical protein